MIKVIHKTTFMVLFLAITSLIYGQNTGYEIAQSNLLSYDKLDGSTVVSKVHLQDALERLEKKFNVSFVYKSGLLDEMRVAPVTELSDHFGKELNKLLIPLNLEYVRLNDRTFVITANPFTRNYFMQPLEIIQHPVRGIVTDARTGETLPGVNILVKGTGTGASTDAEGQFELTAPSVNDTLIFSFIGYQRLEVPIEGRTEINVELIQQTVSTEEVVVTALGIAREKKTLGYSSTTIVGEDLAVSSTINPVNALQGRISGVAIQPTDGGTFGGSRITLRGNSVLGGNNQPIFVVDGVVYDNQTSGGSQWSVGGDDWGNNLKNLNPDEFESVTVLKGAAATALYGSRAINGVVEITTKKGHARPGIGVKLSQRMHIKDPYDGPAFQNRYGPGTVPGYASGLDDPHDVQGEFLVDSEGRTYYQRTDLSYGPRMDGETMVLDYDNQTMVPNSPTPDNFLDLYERGTYSNTNLQLDGGNENTTFLISASNSAETGTTPRNDFNRSSVFSRVTHRLNDYLSADVGISYSHATAQNPPRSDFQQSFITSPFYRNYNTAKWQNHYQADHGGVPSTDHNDPYASVPGLSRFFSLYENTSQQIEESLRLTANVNLRLTDWFNIDLDGYLNNYYTKSETKELGSGFANAGGYYHLGHNRQEQIDGKILFNFLKQINQDFYGSFTLGAEHWSTETSLTSANTEGGLIVPGQYFIDNSVNTPNANASVENTKALNSVYGFGNLEYRDQLFLQVTGRHDWTSTLTYADGTGNNNYFYPSINLSWLATETFALPAFLPYAQLRASYAEVGNDYSIYSINPGFSHAGNILSVDGQNLVMVGYNSNTVPNLSLKPERKKSWEFGFDLRFLDERLGIDLTWYKENTFNQILDLPVPGETGVTAQLINAGDIQNRGVELGLDARLIEARDLRWNVDFTFTRNRNTILALHEDIERFNLYEDATYGNVRVGTVAFVGEEWGVLYSDSAPEVNKAGQKLLAWNDGTRGAHYIRSNEQQEVGNMNPDFLGSMTTDIFFRGFSLSVLLDAKIGGDVVSYVGRYGHAYGNLESSLKWRDAKHGGMEWTSRYTGNTYQDGMIPDGVFQDGTVIEGTDVSGWTYQRAYDQGIVEPTHAGFWHYWNNSWSNGVINENVVHENSYIGIREVMLGYTLPRHIANSLYLSSLRVSVFGRDLGFLYKTMPNNIHPFSVRNTHAGSAHVWGAIPYIRTIGLNLDIEI